MKRILISILAVALLFNTLGGVIVTAAGIKTQTNGLIFNGSATAPVIVDSGYTNSANANAERSYTQILRAVGDLRQDIAMVTGGIDCKAIQKLSKDSSELQTERLNAADQSKVPALITDITSIESDYAIIVGDISNSSIIKQLIANGKLDEAKTIEGEWEAYVIKEVLSPVSGVDKALVIAGSDARGTIYGIYKLSESIGVSPFYWYSDVPVKTQSSFGWTGGTVVNEGPDVKYRGIFINDEEESNEWAKSFFKEAQTPGVNYYRRVFEMVLRMGGNTLWPAMHGCSTAFNKVLDTDGIPINAKEAAKYGIIMSASHCELMLRNNVGEWHDWFNANSSKYDNVHYKGEYYKSYDFTLNEEMLLDYWRERIITNKDFESILALGVRGPHDEAFNCEDLNKYKGNNESEKKVNMMIDVITKQRGIIVEVYGEENLKNVPQVFIPYKEMNDVYNAGLNEFFLWDGSRDFNGDGVIDWKDDNTDIILMWAEDNENYLRQDLTDEEASRAGGAGVYYHISYWGPPTSYLWLNSTSLYEMSEQMHRAYSIGANDYWILNVGDIKPSETSMEFFLKMAWDVETWNDKTVLTHLTEQVSRDYNLPYSEAEKLAGYIGEFYEMNGVRKAEFYGKASFGSEPMWFNPTAFGDETMLWLEKATALKEKMDAVYESLPEEYKGVFYQQIYYNVLSLYDVIEQHVYLSKNHLAAEQGRIGSATVYADLAKAVRQRFDERVNKFNSFNSGKWTNFIKYVRAGAENPKREDGEYKFVFEAGEGIGVCGENSSKTLRLNSLINSDKSYFDVYSLSSLLEKWEAVTSDSWIILDSATGETRTEQRVIVSADWQKLSNGENKGKIEIYSVDKNGTRAAAPTVTLNVAAVKSNVQFDGKSYIEANGYVAIEAEHYTEAIGGADGRFWGLIESNGVNGDTMKALPDTATKTTDWANTAKLRYRVYFEEAGTYSLSLNRRPVSNEGKDNGTDRSMNVAVGVGTSTPKTLNGNRYSGRWEDVLLRQEILTTSIKVEAGWNDIYVYMSDASFVFDRMVIETVRDAVPDAVLGAPISPNNIVDSTPDTIGTLPIALAQYNSSQYSATITMGESIDFDVAGTVSVSSSASGIAKAEFTADKITVYGIGVGKAIITAELNDGSKAIISVFVSPNGEAGAGVYVANAQDCFVINSIDALNNTKYAYTTVSTTAWNIKGSGIEVESSGNQDKWLSTTWESLNGDAPGISFTVRVDKTGDYFVYLNTNCPDVDADSYHLFVDMNYVTTHNDFALGDLMWNSKKNTINLSEGEHTFTIFGREDGFALNQILIAPTSFAAPASGTLLEPSGNELKDDELQPDDPDDTPTDDPEDPPADDGDTPAVTDKSDSESDSFFRSNSQGRIIINAKSALAGTAYSNCAGSDLGHIWSETEKGVQVMPNEGKNWTTGSIDGLEGKAPSLEFKFKVDKLDEYYVFINMSNPDNGSDSYFVAVDGKFITEGTWYVDADGTEHRYGDGVQIENEKWYSTRQAITLTEGEHTIKIYAREDGLTVNQIIITDDKALDIPNGEFFNQSPRDRLEVSLANINDITLGIDVYSFEAVASAGTKPVSLTVSSDNESVVIASADGLNINLFAVSNGEATVTVTASAEGYNDATAEFKVTVNRETTDEYILGDVNADGIVDNNDAIYLLYHTIFGESDYPVNQPCDFNGDGIVDNNDAIYLLYHTIFGDADYPLFNNYLLT